MKPLIADLALARRLERAEALANCAFVEARARRDASVGACWIEVAGARAMFDGPNSPCTQTFGLGLFDAVTPRELDRIEAFFRDRGAPVHHEVSPLAHPTLPPMLVERGYAPFEFTTVMARDLPGEQMPGEVSVALADASEIDVFATTAAAGWVDTGGTHDFAEMMRTVAASKSIVGFIARIGEQPLATASLNICGDVALLAGGSTIPAARNRGAQRSLLQARLEYAAKAGCELAMVCAEPGGASQRNAQRQGFQIVYTRIKWRRGV